MADMDLVHLGRTYVAALCAVLVAAGAVVAIGGHRKANRPPSTGELRTMEAAALGRLKFPQDFVRAHHGCTTPRCYLVGAPASRVASMMPGLLRSSGIQAPGALRAAEPVSALRAGHWATGFRDPMVIACRTSYTSAKA